jgi:hypothetical protein
VGDSIGNGVTVSIAVGSGVGVAVGGTGVSVSVGVGGRGVHVSVGVGVGGTGVHVGDTSATAVKVGDGFLVGLGVFAPRSGVRVGIVCCARSCSRVAQAAGASVATNPITVKAVIAIKRNNLLLGIFPPCLSCILRVD